MTRRKKMKKKKSEEKKEERKKGKEKRLGKEEEEEKAGKTERRERKIQRGRHRRQLTLLSIIKFPFFLVISLTCASNSEGSDCCCLGSNTKGSSILGRSLWRPEIVLGRPGSLPSIMGTGTKTKARTCKRFSWGSETNSSENHNV